VCFHPIGHVAVFFWQDLVKDFYNRDLNTEAAHDLAELTADRPTAKNDHTLGLCSQLVENCLVSKKWNVLYAIDGWNSGTRAGCNHKVFCLQLVAINYYPARRFKARLAGKNIDSQRFKALD